MTAKMQSRKTKNGPEREFLAELAETAETAVRAAGKIQRDAFDTGAAAEVVSPKDLKMEVDRACEAAMVDRIRRRYPRHRILAEEGGDLGGDDEYLWVIDPLDGTVNFFHGLPQFCACAACCHLPKGAPLPATGPALLETVRVGAVLLPLPDILYLGIAGEGAFRNGRPVSAGRQTLLAETVVGLSFGKSRNGIDRISRISAVLAGRARKLRSYGSAGHDIVQVADGRLGGLIYQGLRIWDIAAAGIVLQEAGGMLTAARQPEGGWNLIAAAPGVHRELMEIAAAPGGIQI